MSSRPRICKNRFYDLTDILIYVTKSVKKSFTLFVFAVLAVALTSQVATAAPKEPLILAFGDSLTAGYGLAQTDGFTAQLAARLKSQNIKAIVHNAGVSGDTSTAGKARLTWVLASLKRRPDLVILELGANDALRGIDPKLTHANLDAMLSELKKRKLKVLLVGMLAPRNMGSDYSKVFDGLYPELAKKYRVAFYPFFLEGVAANPKLNQADGMHPNTQGIRIIVDKMLPIVKKSLGH